MRHFFRTPSPKTNMYIQDRYFLEMRSIHIMYAFTTMACISIGFNTTCSQKICTANVKIITVHTCMWNKPVAHIMCRLHQSVSEAVKKGSKKILTWVVLWMFSQELRKVLRIEAWRKCCALRLDESAAHSVPEEHRYFFKKRTWPKPPLAQTMHFRFLANIVNYTWSGSWVPFTHIQPTTRRILPYFIDYWWITCY